MSCVLKFGLNFAHISGCPTFLNVEFKVIFKVLMIDFCVFVYTPKVVPEGDKS